MLLTVLLSLLIPSSIDKDYRDRDSISRDGGSVKVVAICVVVVVVVDVLVKCST